MSKVYKYTTRGNLNKAIEDCNIHQDWNIINIYPTGWKKDVCIVYYIEK